MRTMMLSSRQLVLIPGNVALFAGGRNFVEQLGGQLHLYWEADSHLGQHPPL